MSTTEQKYYASSQVLPFLGTWTECFVLSFLLPVLLLSAPPGWSPRTGHRDLPAQSRLLPEGTPTSEALAPGGWGPRTVVRLPSSLNRHWRVETLLQGSGLVCCSLKTAPEPFSLPREAPSLTPT